MTNTTPDPDGAPASGPAAQVTSVFPGVMGCPWKIQQPDGAWKTNA